MTDHLSYREQHTAAMREIIGENPFLLRFALYYAAECLDLNQLGHLVDALSATVENPDTKRLYRVAQLEEERLKPSRLS